MRCLPLRPCRGAKRTALCRALGSDGACGSSDPAALAATTRYSTRLSWALSSPLRAHQRRSRLGRSRVCRLGFDSARAMQLPKRAYVQHGTRPNWGIWRARRACRCKSAPIHVKARSHPHTATDILSGVGTMLGKLRKHVEQLDAGSELSPRGSWCCERQAGGRARKNGASRLVIADWQSRRRFRQFSPHSIGSGVCGRTQPPCTHRPVIADPECRWQLHLVSRRAFGCASRGVEASRRHHSFEDRATIGVLPTLANAENLGVSRCLLWHSS